MSRASDLLLEAIQRIQANFIEDAPAREVFDNLLATLLQLTDSEYGFIGEVLETEAGAPYLRTRAITNIAWDEATQALYAENEANGMEFFNLDTLFGAVLRTGEPVITNDPDGDPRSGGRPPGHPPLRAFLGLPLRHRDSLVGMVGIANREKGYDEELVRLLEPFSATCSGLIVAYQNVQQRRAAEAALRESEQRFRQLAENIHEVFWTTDPVSGDVVYVSAAYESIWGRKVEDLYANSLNWVEGIHEEDRGRVHKAFDRFVESHRFDEEYRVVRPDGSERWIHDRGFPIFDDDGVLTRIVGIAEDVTVRRRMSESLRRSEERLRHSQKIEALGRVAGGVSHDFNNLLTVINGNTKSLMLRIQDGPERTLLEQIQAAGERAAGMTKQLLAFSRKQVLKLRLLDLRDFAADLRNLLPPLLGELVHFEIDVAEGPLVVRADDHQLVQVVMNLAVNARDAMPDGGGFRIRVEPEITDDGEPRCAEITVSDTGTGIDDSVLPQIFDPFFTTKAEGRGTGLGLSTAYGIITQLGGDLEVATEKGAGTTFKIRLPLADPQDPREESGLHRAADGPPRTVLVVEDDLLVRSFIKMTLEDAGHSVVEAADAEAAQRHVDEHGCPFDLLIADVVLPGSSGVALAERLAQVKPDLVVLFVSGYTADYAAEFGVAEGGKNFLQKPFEADALLARMARLMGDD